eukprot:GFKZ01007066.1.p1 GENE.GFKZ01007066.1~~GFKZ01007066.1.p1  ORF type:complete len:284 (-),score=15.27 GFKZ01007066.1:922-1746(-)
MAPTPDPTLPTSNPLAPSAQSNPQALQSSKSLAYTLSAFFLTTAALFIVTFASDFQAATLSGWYNALSNSPWGASALVDYVVGSVFAAMFVWLRDGPGFVFVPARVIAIVAPFVGSVMFLVYMAWLMFRVKSVDGAIVPLGERVGMRPVFDPPAKKGVSVGIGLLFGVLLVGLVGVVLRAVAEQPLSEGLRDVREVSYHYVTLWDVGIGLLVPALVIFVRERGKWGIIALWWVGLAVTGNLATCLYVLSLARKSIRKNLSFRVLLLSEEGIRPQ